MKYLLILLLCCKAGDSDALSIRQLLALRKKDGITSAHDSYVSARMGPASSFTIQGHKIIALQTLCMLLWNDGSAFKNAGSLFHYPGWLVSHARKKVAEQNEFIFSNAQADERQSFASKPDDQPLKEQRQEAQIRKDILNMAVAGVLLLLVITISLFYNREVILKKNYQISRQKQEIEILHSDLQARMKERTRELRQAYDEIGEAMAKGQGLERKHMAAELHDMLGGLLASVCLGFEALKDMNMSDRERKIFNRIAGITEGVYDEVRLLSHNYYPEELEKQGLVTALQKLVEKLNLYSKTHFQLVADKHISPLPVATAQHLYAICLELSHNIEKHAFATTARFNLTQNDRMILLNIQDDGKRIGSGPVLQGKEGMGLKNIRERLKSMNGSLTISSAYKGTDISVQIPVPQLTRI